VVRTTTKTPIAIAIPRTISSTSSTDSSRAKQRQEQRRNKRRRRDTNKDATTDDAGTTDDDHDDKNGSVNVVADNTASPSEIDRVRLLRDILRAHGHDADLKPVLGRPITATSWEPGDILVRKEGDEMDVGLFLFVKISTEHKNSSSDGSNTVYVQF